MKMLMNAEQIRI